MALGIAIVLAAVAWALERRRRRTQPVPPGYQAHLVLPHEAPFELYHNALSLCSMKVRLALAELGIPYRSRPVDLIETGRYENIRPALLAVNPAGTVPVLLHEGHPIYESHEQIRYLARVAPQGAPSLVPVDLAARAEMETWIDYSSLVGNPVEEPGRTAGNAIPGQTLPLFATMMERVPVWRLLEGFLFHFDRMRPLLFAMLRLGGIENMDRIPPVAAAIRRSREDLRGFLDRLEAQLAQRGGPWILGEAFTLADVSWLVIFERLRQASCEEVFLDPSERPEVAAYWERLRTRPSYREAILEHSHSLIEYGRRRIAEAKAQHPRVRVLLEGEAS
jgi:glutathione S-transferase